MCADMLGKASLSNSKDFSDLKEDDISSQLKEELKEE